MMPDTRSPCYWEEDRFIIRASSFGSCLGSLVRGGIGMTPAIPPADIQRRWAEGSAAEPVIVEEVQRQGWVTAWTGEGEQLELELFVGSKIVIRCHPDGLAIRLGEGGGEDDGFPGNSHVLECKALRPSMREKPFPPYAWQMSIEMAASGFPGLWAYGVKGEDGKLVTDNGHPRVDVVEQKLAPHSLLEIKRRALKIYHAVTGGNLLECDWKQYPCGFYREDDTACGQSKSRAEDLALPPSLVREYGVLKDVAERCVADLEEVKVAIKSRLRDLPGDKYTAGNLVMTKKRGAARFDRRAFAAEHAETAARYTTRGADSWEIRVMGERDGDGT